LERAGADARAAQLRARIGGVDSVGGSPKAPARWEVPPAVIDDDYDAGGGGGSDAGEREDDFVAVDMQAAKLPINFVCGHVSDSMTPAQLKFVNDVANACYCPMAAALILFYLWQVVGPQGTWACRLIGDKPGVEPDDLRLPYTGTLVNRLHKNKASVIRINLLGPQACGKSSTVRCVRRVASASRRC
jgi:hypothetical protein